MGMETDRYVKMTVDSDVWHQVSSLTKEEANTLNKYAIETGSAFQWIPYTKAVAREIGSPDWRD